jgi:hypothetical protein
MAPSSLPAGDFLELVCGLSPMHDSSICPSLTPTKDEPSEDEVTPLLPLPFYSSPACSLSFTFILAKASEIFCELY